MDAEFPSNIPHSGDSFDHIDPPDDTGTESESYMTLREKVACIWRSAREDYSRTDTKGKAIIGGFVTNIGYELFIGNEVVTPLLGGQTLDKASGVGGVAVSTLVTSIPVYLQQRVGGTLSRHTAQRFPSVSREAYGDLNDGESGSFKSFHDLPLSKKAFYSFVLGSTFNVTREAVVTGNTEDETLKPVEKASAITTASMVATLAAGANIANQRFQDNNTVQLFIDHGIKNPLVWLTIGGGLIAKDGLRARRNRKNVTVKENLPDEER